jgi:crotonobetainyl-CoA:carnitine CoA-transferase CaiB-like acyl-CoA transferase
MPGPLFGVRVVEVAQVYAVPAAATLLADLGAEVIKVEPPWGDSTRYGRPVLPGEGKNYIGLNHGKRTICLDLTRADARAVLDDLIATADILLLSLRADQVEAYGLSYDRCRGLRPDLIYAVNSAMGMEGPQGGFPGYDMTITAMSGIGAVQGYMRDGQLVAASGLAVSDAATAFVLCAGVSAALYHRVLTGEGQRIETSNLASALNCQLQSLNWFAATDPPVLERFRAELAELRRRGADWGEQQQARARLLGRLGGANIYYRYYRTADGYLSVGAISPDLARRFRAATGIDDPRARPDFDPDRPADRAGLDALAATAERAFASRTTDEWVAALTKHRVPHARVNFPEEAIEDPQVTANGYVVELEHELLGPYRVPAPPLRMSVTPVEIGLPAAPLDRHTDEVLEELGYDPGAIAALRASGAAGRAAELKTDYH